MNSGLAPEIGYDGHPPEQREPRDLDGRGSRNVEHQVWRLDTLDRLLARQTIEPHHHDAGRKLQGDWEIGSATPCSSSQTTQHSANGVGPSVAKLAAMGRYVAAVASLGPAARECIMAIVIRNEPVVFAAAAHKVDHRAFTGAFVAAIDQLAHHYGLVT